MKSNQLIIPPRPTVLLEIQKLMQAEDTDLPRITQLIKQDVGLYSVILSCVNSPWMGLRQEVSNIETAITLMGLKQVINLLQAVLVRATFKDMAILESFWDAATDVAAISQALAKRYTTLNPDDAYSSGMLHNAGIPIMLLNFEGYGAFISQNAQRPINELCVLERQSFATDHYLQGALMAKTWHMGNEVSLAIRYQPIAQSVLTGKKELSADICSLLAVLTLAKDISHEYQNYWKTETSTFNSNCGEAACRYLDIPASEYAEFKEDAINDILSEKVA